MTSLRMFTGACVLVSLTVRHASADNKPENRPNIVVIHTDDQGDGDLSCYGSETIRTARIDELAAEGTRFTNLYAQIVFSPSRTALFTGRYPGRSPGCSMPASEITITELLHRVGYVTGCVGKWDVSNRAAIPDRMPNAQGFDYFYGTLGANDNGKVLFHENNDVVGNPDDMAGRTRLYTDMSIEFLKTNRKEPFFLYLAHTMGHAVIDASVDIKGKSKGGLYGDTVEELDYHIGRLLDSIDDLGLRDSTLVILITDNGPWNNLQQGSARKHGGKIAWGFFGPLREGKGSTYEGGHRVPCIVRWPGHVTPGGTSDAVFATIDFLPPFGKCAGFETPPDRIVDGVDQSDLMTRKSEAGAHNDFFCFCKDELHAVRKGQWKLILPERRKFYGYVKDKGSSNVELHNRTQDAGGSSDVARTHSGIVEELLAYAKTLLLPEVPYDERIKMQRPDPRPPKQQEPALLQGSWREHGFSESQREDIRAAFQAGIDRHVIPGGALMLIHNGEIVMNEAFGVADLESGRPFRTSSPCRIASLTKPHTATLLVKLAAQGKVDLAAPVHTWLPEFRQMRIRGAGVPETALTLQHCLSHTAGFPGNNALKARKDHINLNSDLSDAITDLATRQLVAEPGTRYAYSRLGYMTAGRVAEVVTGKPFPELMKTVLLKPLGADVATFTPSKEILARMPVSYDRTKTGFRVRKGTGLGTTINPGGSLVSTLDNVARLLCLHRNQGRVGTERFLSADLLQQMYKKQPSTPGVGYGLGFNIMRRHDDGTAARIRHTGASGTIGIIDFERDLIIVVLTQIPQQQTIGWRNALVNSINAVFPLFLKAE